MDNGHSMEWQVYHSKVILKQRLNDPGIRCTSAKKLQNHQRLWFDQQSKTEL